MTVCPMYDRLFCLIAYGTDKSSSLSTSSPVPVYSGLILEGIDTRLCGLQWQEKVPRAHTC